MKELTGAQKQYLKGLAHHLKPVVLIGKHGLTEEVTSAVDEFLGIHELIKIKFLDYRDQKKELTAEIAKRSQSEFVSMVGNIAVLYREQPDPEKRKITLPVKR